MKRQTFLCYRVSRKETTQNKASSLQEYGLIPRLEKRKWFDFKAGVLNSSTIYSFSAQVTIVLNNRKAANDRL